MAQSNLELAPVLVDGMQVGVIVSRASVGELPSIESLASINFGASLDAPFGDDENGNIGAGNYTGDTHGQGTTTEGRSAPHGHSRIKPSHGPVFRGPRHEPDHEGREQQHTVKRLPREGLPGSPSGPAVKRHPNQEKKPEAKPAEKTTEKPAEEHKEPEHHPNFGKRRPEPKEPEKTPEQDHEEKTSEKKETEGKAEKGKANESDIDYIAKHGGHSSHMEGGSIKSGRPGASIPVDPEFAARLHSAGEAYTKETGKEPHFGEMDRGPDVQSVYYNRYKTGRGGIAAAPGRSRHQSGKAEDTPSGDFLNWLHKHGSEHGLHFPVYEKRGDDYGHTEPINDGRRMAHNEQSSHEEHQEPADQTSAQGVRGARGGPSGEAADRHGTANAPDVPVTRGRVPGGFDRSTIEREVQQNPQLMNRAAAMVAGEIYPESATNRAMRVQLQTAMNRAQARGHSFDQALWDTAHHGQAGYYPIGTFNRGQRFVQEHPEWLERFRRDVWQPSMQGSTETELPGGQVLTGNASADVAEHQRARGTRTLDLRGEHGDQYFVEGPFHHDIPRNPRDRAGND